MCDDRIVGRFVNLETAILVGVTLRQDDETNRGRGHASKKLSASAGVTQCASVHEHIAVRGGQKIAITDSPTLPNAGSAFDCGGLVSP